MSDVNIAVGAKLDPSYKDSLHEAITAVREAAEEMNDPLTKVATGTRMWDAALDYLKDTAKEAVLGPLGAFLVSVGAIDGAMRLLERSSRSVEEGLHSFSSVQELTTEFRALLKSTGEAEARMGELQEFTANSPFKLADISGASKTLQALTNGALATGDGLRKVGDAAAQSNGSLQEVSVLIGRMYDDLQNGRPLDRTARRLEELGIMSAAARNQIERLQREGRTGAEVWAVFDKELDKSAGSMALLSQTLPGLTASYEEAKEAVSREMGEGFADTEMQSIKAATDVTKNFIPVAKEASEVMNSFGLANWPSMWFPLFDVQIKQFMAYLLQAKEAWVAFVNILATVGFGLAASVFVTMVANIRSWVTWARNAAVASREWALAQKELVLSTELSTAALQANIVAVTENGAAALRARAAILLQAGAAGLMRMAMEKLVAVLRLFAEALISPIGILATAAAALYSYYNHIQIYIKTVQELGAATVDRVKQIATERDAIISVSDKVDALTKAYTRLKEQRDAVANAPDDAMKAFAEKGVTAIEAQIARTEALDDGRLHPGTERQNLINTRDENLPENGDAALSRRVSVQEKLFFLEQQRTNLLARRAQLEGQLAGTEARSTPAALAAVDKQVAALRSQLSSSQQRLEAAETRAQGRAGGANFARVRALEAPLQADLQQQIDDLISAKTTRSGASETARTELQKNANDLDGNSDRARELRLSQVAEERARAERLSDLGAEQQILGLKTQGLQRVRDEAAIRQRLVALELKAAYGLPDSDLEKGARIAELQNKYLEQQLVLTQAQREAEQQLVELAGERLSRLDALISKLPKALQIPYLQEEKRRLAQQAADLDVQANAKGRAGDQVGEAHLMNQAEGIRDRLSDFTARLLEDRNDAGLPGVVDSMQKIGGGGRIAHVGQGHDTVVSIKDIVGRIETILRDGTSDRTTTRVVPR